MDEDISKNELVASFMDLTGKHDVAFALSTLDHFNWNIDDAVCAVLNEDTPHEALIETEMKHEESTQPMPPSPPVMATMTPDWGQTSASPIRHSPVLTRMRSISPMGARNSNLSVKIIQFEVILPGAEDEHVEHFRVPETDTIRDLKRMIVERTASQLMMVLTANRSTDIILPLEEYFYMENLIPTHKAYVESVLPLSDSTLLRVLGLSRSKTVNVSFLTELETLDGYWAELNEKLSRRQGSLPSNPSGSSGGIREPVELHFYVQNNAEESGTRKVLRPRLDQSINQVRRDVSSLTGISSSRQIYSLSDLNIEENSVLLEAFCTGLNSFDSDFGLKTLEQIGLRPGTRVYFELKSNRASAEVVGRGRDSINEDDSSTQMDEDDFYEPEGLDDDDYDDEEPYDDIRIVSEDSVPMTVLHDQTKEPLINASNCLESPSDAISVFCAGFSARYCFDGVEGETAESVMPSFMICSLDEAIQNTLNQPRVFNRLPLVIYLHSDRSIACHLFCQQILNHPSLKRFFESQQVNIWPWDVTLPRAKERLKGWFTAKMPARITSHVFQFPDSAYPIMLLLGKLAGQIELMAQVQGTGKVTSWPLFTPIDFEDELDFPLLGREPVGIRPSEDDTVLSVDAVVAQLLQVFTGYHDRLQPEMRTEQERVMRENVIAEQQAAYEESLRQDRLKAETKAKAERELQQKLVQERQRQENAEQQAREQRQKHAAEVPDQPPDPKTEEGKEFLRGELGQRGIATLRFRLPSQSAHGKSTEIRRFAGMHTLNQLCSFVESIGFPLVKYKLLTTYPRRDLTNEDDAKQLAELGLVPEETLIVEER